MRESKKNGKKDAKVRDEVKDYGYGEVTTTPMFGEPHTRIFTGPMSGGSSPYFDVKGRGAQG